MYLPTPSCHLCPKLQKEILQLKKVVRHLEEQLDQRNQLIIEQTELVTEQAKQLESRAEHINSLKKQAFGSRSERLSKLNKPKAANDSADNKSANKEKKTAKKKSTSPDRSDYRKLPLGLDTVEVNSTLASDDKRCEECGELLRMISAKVTEQLDVIPELLRIMKTIRHQYACGKCKNKKSMKLSPFPNSHYKNSMFSPGLLSWIVNYKYNYHMPAYRICRVFSELGYNVSDKTINSSILRVARLLQPLDTLNKEIITKSNHIFSDDTTCSLIVPGLKKTKTARLWVYITKEAPKIITYEFTISRKGINPQKFLKNFKGYLQTDAYKGYQALYLDEQGKTIVTPVYCMGHSRRKFYSIAEQTKTYGLADMALEYYGELYKIEDKAKAMTDNERYALRQEQSIPILNKLHSWLKKTLPTVMPNTKIYDAIFYALNNWNELTNYCLDGRLEIDNNRAERMMRGPTLGENNYMFFGSEVGGKAAAIFYSFIESCKANNIPPFSWLTDVIKKLQYYKITEIEKLLPQNWKQNIELETQPIEEVLVA